MALSIRNFTRKTVPAFPYTTALEYVLPLWDVSLVFAGTARAAKLNRTLRQKNYTPNVLSYVVGKKNGEIIICLEVAKKQAPRYDMSYQTFVFYLFIHGLLHLKGYQHGASMEHSERVLLKHFSKAAHTTTHVPTHSNRH